MASYHFFSRWRLRAPVEPVWEALAALDRQPEWWSCVPECRQLTPGAPAAGTQYLQAFRARLPYTLRVTTTITRRDAPRLLAYETRGDLVGQGAIRVSRQGDGTEVEFPWDCATTARWMNLLAPLLRPLFVWNHAWMMARGQTDLAGWLEKQGY